MWIHARRVTIVVFQLAFPFYVLVLTGLCSPAQQWSFLADNPVAPAIANAALPGVCMSHLSEHTLAGCAA